METSDFNQINALNPTNSSESLDTTLASKSKVTFQVGSEEDDMTSYLSNKRMKSCEMAEMISETLEPVKEHHFKETVERLMHDKETWDELTKESGKDFGAVAKQLLKKSSIYAVSQVGHAESPYRKMLWLLVLVAGLVGCCYEIQRFLLLYFQYPVVVNLHVENKWNLEFPAVTVCNLNRMKKQYEMCMERNKTVDECLFLGIGEGKINKVKISERRSVASCSVQLSGIKDKNFQDRVEFLTKYAKMDSNRRKEFGDQFHDLIKRCSYNGEECSFEHFSDFQSLRYGNCFTFNKRINESETILKTSSVGIMSGLDLVLDLDPRSYLSITPSIGARVIIHDSNRDPNPEDEGVNISPGYETTLSMKQSCVRRLPAPYKDRCVDYGKDTSVRGRNQDECLTSCLQEQNYFRCQCIDPTLPSLEDYEQCNMTNVTKACCLDEVLISMADQGLPCECPLPCFTTAYGLRISTSVWPSGISHFEFDCYSCKDKDALQLIRNKQARLKVYYSTLERATYEQKEMFQNSELFSHLGGQLGLWLGLSLVAVFEIVENVMYLGKYCVSLACCSKKRQLENAY